MSRFETKYVSRPESVHNVCLEMLQNACNSWPSRPLGIGLGVQLKLLEYLYQGRNKTVPCTKVYNPCVMRSNPSRAIGDHFIPVAQLATP